MYPFILHVRMYACMHVCMYACMYVCMYVCIYIHAYIHTCYIKTQQTYQDMSRHIQTAGLCTFRVDIWSVRTCGTRAFFTARFDRRPFHRTCRKFSSQQHAFLQDDTSHDSTLHSLLHICVSSANLVLRSETQPAIASMSRTPAWQPSCS